MGQSGKLKVDKDVVNLEYVPEFRRIMLNGGWDVIRPDTRVFNQKP
jgi:hypothetical protein